MLISNMQENTYKFYILSNEESLVNFKVTIASLHVK